MNKKFLTERDICTQFITPAVVNAGWDLQSQVREQVYFTKGRIIVRGKMVSRGKRNFADYLLYYRPNVPIALIEAKDNNHPLAGGMQQGLGYAEILDVPFVFSSNGDGFIFHDRTGITTPKESEIALDAFPSPQTLWSKYRAWKELTSNDEQVVLQNYFDDGSGKEPRYYQRVAINRVIEAISKGQNRILLVMATGTGKTYTAFQIIWRLWKADKKKRILFLADRNVLVDQTMVNDFRPFGAAMAKLSTNSKTIERDDGSKIQLKTAVDKKQRRIDTSYEIYLALYQAITGPDESQKLYKELSRDFFDLIVVDECHRGSAAEDSAWREILEYFSSATQIGMTATPKETEYASNIEYFGDPIYIYSLKQGISDGFLAPYKVIKVHIDKDIEGYRPTPGETDKYEQLVEDRLYNQKDFDRKLVIDERTKLVAKRITEFLAESGDPYQKTIVFCVDTEHAARMRQALINENQELVQQNSRYVMRLTGDDTEGTEQLDNFIDPETPYPVIVTTSRLLSTGVDVQTCRVIALDREVGSMTEFKQILGRGTRVHEDTKKYFFTLIDFRKATNHFADPDFDGDPVQVYQPKPDGPMEAPEDFGPDEQDTDQETKEDERVIIDVLPPNTDEPDGPPKKYYLKNGKQVSILAERVEYLDEHGKLVTESLRDFSKRTLRSKFASLDDFLSNWKAADRKQAIIDELANEGLLLAPLADEVGKDLDPFDLICHVAFDQPPLTRRQRAENVRKKDVFSKHGPQARAVLEALLQKYQDQGVTELDDPRILKVSPFDTMGTPLELLKSFGGRDAFGAAVHEIQSLLYEVAA
ncbi:MAG TPA: DEAD/DEAH box helicase family protein [Terriglobales bacterium]|nr:DEAD/DEAH box helicase family protein [Terriglobales bacterium]